MNNNDLKFIQDPIGYNFKNLDLLRQAFVRKSYAREYGGEDNEVLEFIGDSALGVVITRILSEKFGFFTIECEDYDKNEDCNEFCCEHSEGELTRIKSKLVEKKTLSQAIDNLGFAKYLIMSEGDEKNKVYRQDSVKEDLFEAIIGSVAIDSEWNFEEIQSVVEIMLNPESFLGIEDEPDYVKSIQEWNLHKNGSIPTYQFQKQNSLYGTMREVSTKWWQDGFACLMKLGELPVFRGFGNSKSDARKNACKLAYEYLEKNDMLYTIRDEIENPNKNDAVSQLETLARRGYFSIPVYDFKQNYDKDGDPIWGCKCHIDEIERYFTSKASSKKYAKKSAAYKMLKYVLNEDALL